MWGKFSSFSLFKALIAEFWANATSGSTFICIFSLLSCRPAGGKRHQHLFRKNLVTNTLRFVSITCYLLLLLQEIGTIAGRERIFIEAPKTQAVHTIRSHPQCISIKVFT
ncbi:unknown protein [Microcystis aeruginosa NIES-843]|uniref:Uncharacterized protein n=1 Tax=Microcystis aeruginosa (strain NIES-843 / IAM M-2473) TaxID=449447 RepID=B0JUQ6_MICAN|nr:unknown protein [Microcystis aeruginosa NIES-843]